MVTDRTKTNCQIVFALIQDIKIDILVADRAYNTIFSPSIENIDAKLVFAAHAYDTNDTLRNKIIKSIIPTKRQSIIAFTGVITNENFIAFVTSLKIFSSLLNVGVL